MKIKLDQILVVLSLISLPFLVYFGASSKSQITINGVVTDFGATADDTGVHYFLIVRLEDTRTVTIYDQQLHGIILVKKLEQIFTMLWMKQH